MIDPVLTVPVSGVAPDMLLSKEWIVTNALGGYASGTILGVNTRRHHGLFIPNLPTPYGRTMMLPWLDERVIIGEREIPLGGHQFSDGRLAAEGAPFMTGFRLDWQIPVWTFHIDGHVIEKKIVMPYGDNTVCVAYTVQEGGPVSLKLRPYCACRRHDGPLGYAQRWPFTVTCGGDNRHEVVAFDGAAALRLMISPAGSPSRGEFTLQKKVVGRVLYHAEAARGLDAVEDLVSPGVFTIDVHPDVPVFFLASTEEWEDVAARPEGIFSEEITRRQGLLEKVPEAEDHVLTRQLVLASDQFVVLPTARNKRNALIESQNDLRTVIAGYHWFTDWGRDTMISLEGLTLCTGRYREARAILKTFGQYVRNGLIPNHFPEGNSNAVYNTVDATFWYFHAVDRYLHWTQDTATLMELYPTFQAIIDWHKSGTDFGIHMDETDGLIAAAAPGLQLTWMDAKVDEWVVTPRRGKPVEVQGLWFNALQLMATWSDMLKAPGGDYAEAAARVRESFNRRFWYAGGGYLFDVIDSPRGDDTSFRPNQILALSLRFPVLDQAWWQPVVDQVERRLLTPYGLRTLDPADANYHPHYEGNRWNRDAAYHQGLVWTWLIGHFLDARARVYQDPAYVGEFLKPLTAHLSQAGLGTISEIFDGDLPHYPRGCIAQAWSVAEVLRCLLQKAAVPV